MLSTKFNLRTITINYVKSYGVLTDIDFFT